jgi:hypothetical protein
MYFGLSLEFAWATRMIALFACVTLLLYASVFFPHSILRATLVVVSRRAGRLLLESNYLYFRLAAVLAFGFSDWHLGHCQLKHKETGFALIFDGLASTFEGTYDVSWRLRLMHVRPSLR